MKSKLLTSTIYFLFLICAVASAQNKYEEGKTYRHELKNGMVVFTVERHIAPLIYHQLTYRVGSRNEHLGVTGISHVVEHMMFKGTPKFPKGVASKRISKNSGVFNAFTANDMTSYYEYFPSNKIDIAFDVESDRMQNCVFDTAEFRSEVKVIRQERRMRSESTANGIMSENLNSVAYMSHPNRDPIIGWPADLDNVTRDQAYQYYKTFYTPNNAFMVLVGDFKTDDIVAQVKKYYDAIPKGPEVKELAIEDQPQRMKKTLSLRHNDLTAVSISMAFHVPTIRHEDGPALRAAGQILGARSRTSRLNKRLVEQAQIAAGAGAGMPTGKDPGLFRVSATVRKDSSYQKVEAMLWEEIRKIQTELVSDHELQKIKNRFAHDYVVNYIKNPDIGTRMSTYETYFGLDYIDEFAQKFQKVTPEDVQRVMKKYLDEEKVTVLYGFPKEGGKKKKSAEGEETPAEDQMKEGYTDDCPYTILGEDEPFYYQKTKEESDETTIDPKSILPPKPIAPMVKKAKLSNGVPIYTIENHLAPSIFIGGVFDVGLIPENEKAGKPGIVGVMSATANRGTASMDYDSLSEKMSFVPFSFGLQGSYKSLYFQGSSLVKDADEMMTTGLELVTKPGFRPADLEKVRSQSIENVKKRKQTVREKAFYYMFEKLFANHPFSESDPTLESLDKITRDDIVNFHNKYVNSKYLSIVMVGDMTHKEMAALADKYFGKWKSSESIPKKKEVPKVKPLPDKEIKVMTENEYTECTIDLGFNTFNDIEMEDEDAVEVLNYIIAGSTLTSRIGVELRDKRGLVYGVKSQLWTPGEKTGYWKFQTKTAPKNTEQVLTVIFSELKKLLESGITDEELATSKKRQLGLLPFFVETPDDVASNVFTIVRKQLPMDFYDKKAQRLMAVTKEDVMKLAKKYFTLDRYICVVNGPIEAKALEGLEGKLAK